MGIKSILDEVSQVLLRVVEHPTPQDAPESIASLVASRSASSGDLIGAESLP